MIRPLIVHLTTFLQGGAGRIVTALAEAQRRDGLDVMVVGNRAPAPGYEHYPEYLARLPGAGVRVVLADSTFTRDSGRALGAVHAVRQALAGRTPAIVHAHAGQPARVGLTLATGLASDVPVLQTVHGWSRHRTASQLADDVATLGRVDGAVFPSRAGADDVAADGACPPRSWVVPNGVARVAPAPALPVSLHPVVDRQSRGARVVVAIGSLTPQKNQIVLVEALAHLGARHDVVVVLVGEGPDADALRARAEAVGVADRVHLTGYLPDAAAVLRLADALVQPSRVETFGLAVVEAFRAGVPVIASRIPALMELVEEDATGWLFDPDDAASLARAVDAVFTCPAPARHAVTTRARARFEDRYALDQMVRGYAGVYDQLMRKAAA